MVPHNARGFESWVVLNSLVKEITELKISKNASARGLILLSIRCGVEIVDTSKVTHYVEFTCSKSHLRASLEKFGREYGLQPKLLKREIQLSLNNKTNFADLRDIWEPCFKLDVLCLAFIYARDSMEMQNISCFGIEDCLTEASRGWKCSGTYNKDREI